MKAIYTKEYTFTRVPDTISTRDFILRSYDKNLPPEAMTADKNKLSKIIGVNILNPNIKKLEIELSDGTELQYIHDPLGGESAKIIAGEEFVRNWANRTHEEYVHPRHTHISYLDGKIRVFLPAIYEHTRIIHAELPEKFPIDNWETFVKDPWHEIAPHIPLTAVIKAKTTKSGVFILKISAPKKEFETSIKKTKKYFIYRNVPFAEGLFDVKVPKNTDVDITSIMSIHDLPEYAKTSPRLQIIDKAAWKPDKVSYEKYYRFFELRTDGIILLYSASEDTLSFYGDIPVEFTVKDGLFILQEILKREDVRIYVRVFMDCL